MACFLVTKLLFESKKRMLFFSFLRWRLQLYASLWNGNVIRLLIVTSRHMVGF